MIFQAPDRFKVAKAFWDGLGKFGLTPSAVVRLGRLPPTLHQDQKTMVTTAQFFALWRAVAVLSPDAAAGLKIGSQVDVGRLPPASLAAFHARDYGDALTRLARFKQLCLPEELRITKSKDECVLELVFLYATEDPPPLLIDAAFATFIELGRQGTREPLRPKRVELKRTPDRTGAHEAFFRCPVKFRARRNTLVLNAADVDRPFVSHNAELLEMLEPGLGQALAERNAQRCVGDQVRWVLKRLLAGNRPNILAVAREIGISGRTLQRRITAEGSSFRRLLLQARRQLAREYLAEPSVAINEAAFLLGYEDTNSFYRAFRSWEGTTPANWRSRQDPRTNPSARARRR